jgi:uncharacterized protein YkwD
MKPPMMLSLLFSVLLATGCSKGELSNDVSSDPPGSSVPTTLNKILMLQLVNDVRKKGCQCGDTYYPAAPVIAWNSQLETAAYTHSEDMYSNKYFDHVAPDGSNGGVRIERAGYDWITFGENIAAGYKSEKEVLDGWLQSPGHCKNIMNKSFKEMGVARVGNYWTQEFGTKANP